VVLLLFAEDTVYGNMVMITLSGVVDAVVEEDLVR
jgi:hypothetical protein